MTGNSVALDTNKAIDLLNDVPDVVAWLGTFSELCLPAATVGELYYGALNSNRQAHNVSRLDAFVARVRLLPTTLVTCRIYAELRFDLKKLGKPIPQNDQWIAASSVEHGVPLVSDDAHFDVIARLRRVRQSRP